MVNEGASHFVLIQSPIPDPGMVGDMIQKPTLTGCSAPIAPIGDRRSRFRGTRYGSAFEGQWLSQSHAFDVPS